MLSFNRIYKLKGNEDFVSRDCKRNFICCKYKYSFIKNYANQPFVCSNCDLLFAQNHETLNVINNIFKSRNKYRVYFTS